MEMIMKKIKVRNPMAVQARMMGKRVVQDKTKYTRKRKHKHADSN